MNNQMKDEINKDCKEFENPIIWEFV